MREKPEMERASGLSGRMPSWAPSRTGSAWRPGASARMGVSEAETQMLGVAVLAAISITSVHSAVCPSYFTMKTFASQPEARERAMEGLWISLGLSTLTSAALYFVFKNWLPAIISEATALALFGIGVAAINSEPPATIPPIEKQEAAAPQQTTRPVVMASAV